MIFVRLGNYDKYDKIDNPLKNAPHTHLELTSDKWDHKYEREEAAYPSEFLRTAKYWPPVGRVDNVYGDKNLFCTCPSIDEYEDTAGDYKYQNPKTGEIFTYTRKGIYRKDGTVLIYKGKK